LAEGITSGKRSWREVMTIAADDATRLLIIDLTCSVRVGFQQYIDDSRAKGSSRGSLCLAAAAFETAAGRMRAKIKHGPDKTGYQCRGFVDQRAIPCAGGLAVNVLVRRALGVPLDADMRMTSLLLQVEQRARYGLQSSLAALHSLGFPLGSMLDSLDLRVLPGALHGSEFLILRPDFRTRMGALQDELFRNLLLLPPCFAHLRVLLMRELGRTWRLHAQILLKNLLLIAQLDLLPVDHTCRTVLHVAEDHEATWAAVAVRELEALHAPRVGEWLDHGGSLTRQQSKRAVWDYCRKILRPAINSVETEWVEKEMLRHPPVTATTALELAVCGYEGQELWSLVHAGTLHGGPTASPSELMVTADE
jgi:hypothetical protein